MGRCVCERVKSGHRPQCLATFPADTTRESLQGTSGKSLSVWEKRNWSLIIEVSQQ